MISISYEHILMGKYLIYLYGFMHKMLVFLYGGCYNILYNFSKQYFQMKNDITSKLERLTLDKAFNKVRDVMYIKRPTLGWIRTIRESLGMNIAQLAKRAGVVSSRIHKIEIDEVDNKLTLNTLENVAEALNCKLFYVLVPEKPLQTMLEDQAKKKAEEENKSVIHSMFLEGQTLDAEDQKEFIKIQSEDLLHNRMNKIWEDD